MDFHTALYHCREIEKHFEELSEGAKAMVPKKCVIVLDQEVRYCMDSDQILVALRELETSIEAQDAESMLRFEDMVDALVDCFDRLITDSEKSGVTGQRGTRKLRAQRESTGKLAQLLCQSSEL